MTNEEIITRTAIQLGILSESEAEQIIMSGKEIPLHTYSAWKVRGYQVKKGEKAVCKVSLWKKSKAKKAKKGLEQPTEDAEQEPIKDGHFFQTTAALFLISQCEQIQTA